MRSVIRFNDLATSQYFPSPRISFYQIRWNLIKSRVSFFILLRKLSEPMNAEDALRVAVTLL